MSKHTPGPWGWENHPYNGEPIALTGGNDTDVLLATGSGEQAWLQVNEADARLIAAAPDLLAELRGTAVWLTGRADLLRNLAADRGTKKDHAQQLRDEAARFDGRAAVIRQTILKATEG